MANFCQVLICSELFFFLNVQIQSTDLEATHPDLGKRRRTSSERLCAVEEHVESLNKANVFGISF